MHVLHDAEHLEVRTPRHVGDARRDLLRALRRGRDHEHLGLRKEAGERHLDVAGAGRHVDEEVVEVAPADVYKELLERLRENQAAPHQGGVLVVDEQTHADDLHPAAAGYLHLVGEDLAGPVGLLRSRETRLHAEHAGDREAPDVGVEHADRESARRERGREVGGDRRLADSALPAADRDDAGGRGDLGRRSLLRRMQTGALHHRGALILGHLGVLDRDLADAGDARDLRLDVVGDLPAQRAGGGGERHLHRDVAVGVDGDVAHHAEVDDRGVELGIEHAREHAADVLRAGRGLGGGGV